VPLAHAATDALHVHAPAPLVLEHAVLPAAEAARPS
jgi:hypothetical protein